MRVRIAAACRNQTLRIEIANTGSWKATQPGGGPGAGLGLGLANVRTRLRQIYPARHRLDVSSSDGWVRVTVEIAHP